MDSLFAKINFTDLLFYHFSFIRNIVFENSVEMHTTRYHVSII